VPGWGNARRGGSAGGRRGLGVATAAACLIVGLAGQTSDAREP
jgi:hypothetical protein